MFDHILLNTYQARAPQDKFAEFRKAPQYMGKFGWSVIAGISLSVATLSLVLANYYHKEYEKSGVREKELQRVLEEKETALQKQEASITHLKQLRQDERNGRIALETKLRRGKQEREAQSGYLYQSIATVQSPFVDRRGTPRQPRLV
ncbi:hypothetical protein EON65_48890, partial [archaeon]